MTNDGPGTKELLRRAGNGDGEAVQELLVRYRDQLRRMVSVRMDPRLAAAGNQAGSPLRPRLAKRFSRAS